MDSKLSMPQTGSGFPGRGNHRSRRHRSQSPSAAVGSPPHGGTSILARGRTGAGGRVAPLAVAESASVSSPLPSHPASSAPPPDIQPGPQYPASGSCGRQGEGVKREDGATEGGRSARADDKVGQELRTAAIRRMASEKISLSVGGRRFVTFASTLHRIPGTRLSMLTKSDSSYDPFCGEFFFDRNPKFFGYILDFYRLGELHFPHCQCGPVLKRELEYWQIPEDYIAPCCWKVYTQYEEEKATLQTLEETFNGPGKQLEKKQNYVRMLNGCQKWKRDAWLFLEDPTSSKFAQVFSYAYVSLLLLSIGVVVLETHPSCRVHPEEEAVAVRVMHFQKENFQNNSTNPKLQMFINTDAHPVLVIIDYICTLFFTIELILKFIVWPGKVDYFCQFFNIIDILSVTPMFINTVITLVHPTFWLDNDIFVGYCILSVSSVFRCVRVLKLIKHHRGLQIIFLALRASMKAILLLLLLIAIGTLVFSTMIYFAEFEEHDNFETIPIGFWWSVVTMTTVGYGDKTPRTPLGYVVGSMCALTGMLITGLPIPVIANSFTLYYTYAGLKAKLDSQKLCLKACPHGTTHGVNGEGRTFRSHTTADDPPHKQGGGSGSRL